MIKRMAFTSYPQKLQFLDLSANMIDLMPTIDVVSDAAKLQYLYVRIHPVKSIFSFTCLYSRNLSQNMLWSLNTNSELVPYTGLLNLYVLD